MAAFVRPGDTVFIPHNMSRASAEEIDALATKYREAMPGVDVYITNSPATIVYRPAVAEDE